MAKSNLSCAAKKAPSHLPAKPTPNFPLGPATCGYWQKRIRGKLHYFGPWGRVKNGVLERLPDDGWPAALARWEREKDALLAGRTPDSAGDNDRPTLADVCNRFLTAKTKKVRAGEMGQRMFDEYRATTARLIAKFGRLRLIADLRPEDFEALRDDLATAYGPVRRANEIQKVKTIFKYALEAEVIKVPVKYGPEFKRPDKAVMRKHRAANGSKMLEPADLRKLLAAAPLQVRAMILLGLNCGLGNHDCAMLPRSALDLDRGWIDFPRPKTGISRRGALWPETIAAVREVLASRPEPRAEDAADKVFLTVRGRPWLHAGRANPVCSIVRDLMKQIGVYRPGLGLYSMRHIFETIGGDSRDQVAVNHVMGHGDSSMASHYRERISDERLRAVSDHVHKWLFSAGGEGGAV